MWKVKSEATKRSFGMMKRLATISAGVASAAILLTSVSADAQIVHRRGAVPDYHVVTSGDTMWDLSGSYYGDTYMWPRLWSYNAHVTNPHWIYPGDIVYLKTPKSGGDPGVEEAVSSTASGDSTMRLPVAGFISAEEVGYVGRIAASPKEADMLSPHDKVWLGFGEDTYSDKEKESMSDEDKRKIKDVKPKVGEMYVVVREVGQIQDEDGESKGHKYVVVGSVRVTELGRPITKKSESEKAEDDKDRYFDTAVVENSWLEMYRGDYLIPYERQVKAVQPVQADRDTVAKIFDSISKTQYFGEQHYVFVDKGAEDGVRVGNRLFIYHRNEGLSFNSEAEEQVPWRRVGQVMILDVRKDYSLAIVTDSKKEVEVGDRLEMYKNH